MTLMVDVFAQFDMILIAIMFSGIIVKMGKGYGTTSWDTHYKKFYLLFTLLITENIIIAIVTNYFLLPFFEEVLLNTYSRIFALTADLILFCNIWFAWTFDYNQRVVVIALTVLALILTVVLFFYQVPF